jgi:hypothetical protein
MIKGHMMSNHTVKFAVSSYSAAVALQKDALRLVLTAVSERRCQQNAGNGAKLRIEEAARRDVKRCIDETESGSISPQRLSIALVKAVCAICAHADHDSSPGETQMRYAFFGGNKHLPGQSGVIIRIPSFKDPHLLASWLIDFAPEKNGSRFEIQLKVEDLPETTEAFHVLESRYEHYLDDSPQKSTPPS